MTVSIADRQGNPVPDGTQINLTTESGVLVPPSCFTAGGTSTCNVQLRSQGSRPANGRVSILAYLPGEEDYVDANGNEIDRTLLEPAAAEAELASSDEPSTDADEDAETVAE